MKSISHPLITASHCLPKFQRRFPTLVQKWPVWAELQDRLYGGGALARGNRLRLRDAHVKCKSPADWLAFAGLVFPAHQQPSEILGFLELAAAHRPKVVMEIGTAQSGTQFLLGQVLDSADLILALDLRVRNRRLIEEFSRPGLKRVCLEGSSYDPRTVDRVIEALQGRAIDLLFIDGDHTYTGVKADYENYALLVRPGGLIAFHDIVEDHLTRYGRSSGGWAGDVPRYWQEISAGKKNWTFIANPDQDGMGIGVVEKVSGQ